MVNFGVVEQGLYRSGFPLERNRPFLQHLGIRTILYAHLWNRNMLTRFLEPKQENSVHTQDLRSFCENNNIRFIYSPFDVNNARTGCPGDL